MMGFRVASAGSHPELLQMVIDVLVHPNAPLVWGQVAKENVGMSSASRRSTVGKAFDQPREPLPFVTEAPLVTDDE